MHDTDVDGASGEEGRGGWCVDLNLFNVFCHRHSARHWQYRQTCKEEVSQTMFILLQ